MIKVLMVYIRARKGCAHSNLTPSFASLLGAQCCSLGSFLAYCILLLAPKANKKGNTVAALSWIIWRRLMGLGEGIPAVAAWELGLPLGCLSAMQLYPTPLPSRKSWNTLCQNVRTVWWLTTVEICLCMTWLARLAVCSGKYFINNLAIPRF